MRLKLDVIFSRLSRLLFWKGLISLSLSTWNCLRLKEENVKIYEFDHLVVILNNNYVKHRINKYERYVESQIIF